MFLLLRPWQTRTHCCRHKCFPVCTRAQHLLRTQILCPGHKKLFLILFLHSVSATNVSQFVQPKKHHGQQCVCNNVSSFSRAFRLDFRRCLESGLLARTPFVNSSCKLSLVSLSGIFRGCRKLKPRSGWSLSGA